MKIIPDGILNGREIARKQNHGKNAAPSGPVAKPAACDRITIESNQNDRMSDAQLITQLKKSIMSEIQAGAPEYKLADLKQQIAMNKYDVNISDIIRKLLLDSPEVNYE